MPYPERSYSGLLPVSQGCKRENFPLLSATVHYDLADVQMLANLTQKYKSTASIEAEIRYVFPLPPDASVCAFKAVIDGTRTIRGVVKEKEKAKAEYEQAVAQGKTAAVLEQENVEIFRVSLGNIRPKQTIEVHISFVAVVSHDGALDSLRLTFPSTIAPRYGKPPGGLYGSYRTNHSALDFSVAVEMGSHIKSITSPSHPIAVTLGGSSIEPSSGYDPTKARVSLASPTLLEKDIVVVLSCQGLDNPRCMVESYSPEEGAQEHTDAYALTLVPRFELPALPSQEYIFLVDRSGSMTGGKMDAVRSALQILLVSLPTRGTCFNIISFGSEHSSLWPSSVAYSAESVKAASAHVDTMTANYGGTEIRNAIEDSFRSRSAGPGRETTSTSVFVLTDGQSYDLEGVQSSIDASVKEAKSQGLLLRVFCMGIGNAVSKAMCEKIARAGQGTAAFVGETEKPDQKLMGLLRAARGGVVEDISIDWGVSTEVDNNQDFELVPPAYNALPDVALVPLSLFNESQTSPSKTDVGPQPVAVTLPPPPRIQQAPATGDLPPFYPGARTSLFAIVKRGKDAPSQNVHINGSVLGQLVTLTVPVSRTTTSHAPVKMLHALAARALIQNIEEGGNQHLSEINKARVLRLAERYGLASSQTSFVAIDDKERSVDVVEPPQRENTGMEYSINVWGPARRKSSLLPGAALFRSVSKKIDSASARIGGATKGFSSSEKSAKVHPTANVISTGFVPPGSSILSSGSGPSNNPSPKPSPVSGEPKRRSMGPKFYGAAQAPSASALGLSFDNKRASTSVAPAPVSISIEAFARLQSFDGSFALSPALSKLIGDARTPSDVDETAWCTLLCVAHLEIIFAREKDVWQVMVEKAMLFVEDALGLGGVEVLALRRKAWARVNDTLLRDV